MSEVIIEIDSWINDDCTIGFLYLDGKRFCCTLELPWIGNAINVSCIPAGYYKAEKYRSPKHGDVILIKDVHGRTYIEIHSGNFTHQILGCILVGDSIKFLDDDGIPDVTNSKRTLEKLLNVLPDEFTLIIKRHY